MNNSDLTEEIKSVLAVLQKGGLILLPLETHWAVAGDATREDAVSKWKALAHSMANSPEALQVLMDHENRLSSYVRDIPEQLWTLIEYAERPLLFHLEHVHQIDERLSDSTGSTPLRISKDSFCTEVIRKLRKPLFAAAIARKSGLLIRNFKDIPPAVLASVDYIVNLRQQEVLSAHPTTVIRLKPNGVIRFIQK